MNVVVTQVPNPGVLVAIGTSTNVTLTAEDTNGNETICSFHLSIEENLGVAEEILEKQIRIYPNPFENQLHIFSEKYVLERLTLFDMRGRKILSFNTSGLETTIDTKDLETAMYLLNIQTASGVIVKQIIKN